MKHYIISSSLNIDNILSAESISPISFYPKRDYGYKYFQSIPGITPFPQNALILFSKLPYFEINDSESENHPMVIEIDDDKLFTAISIVASNTSCDIYSYRQTIHLTPWNCKVLFFSQRALIMAKMKCDDSRNNKLNHYFRIELVSKESAIPLEAILNGVTFDNTPFTNTDYLSRDNKMNVFKGFLYGYCLGLTKTISPDVAGLLAVQKQIYGIVAAIMNNHSTSNQTYNSKLKELDEQYKRLDPNRKLLNQLWAEELRSRFKSDEAIEAFKKIQIDLNNHSLITSFAQIKNIPVRKSIDLNSGYPYWKKYQDELSSYTQDILYNDSKNRLSVDLRKTISIIQNIPTIVANSYEDTLYNKFVEIFLFNEPTSLEDLRLNKLEVATKFKNGFKNIMLANSKKWDGSKEWEFLISLLKNIANSEPFNLKEAPDNITQSIAAFLLKGEDFDSMMRYLQENGISEYKYVLGLWGAACGYVDMPRFILHSLIQNKESFCKLYKSVHFLLNNEEIDGSFPEIAPIDYNHEQEEKHEHTRIIQSKMNSLNNSKSSTQFKRPNTQLIFFELKEMFDSNEFKKMSDEAQKYYESEVSKLYKGNFDIEFIERCESLNFKRTKGLWRDIIKKFRPINEKKSKEKNRNRDFAGTRDLFAQQKNPQKEFYTDDNAFSFIQDLITEEETKKKIFSDLKWFQKEFHKTRQERKTYKYDIDEKDNMAVIQKFVNLKRGRDKNTNKEQASYFTDELRQKIKDRLMEIYCNNNE